VRHKSEATVLYGGVTNQFSTDRYLWTY